MTSPPPGDPGASQPEFKVARAYDFADPVSGPGFEPGHAVVEDPAKRDRLAVYLRAGYPILTTTTRISDVLDPTAGGEIRAPPDGAIQCGTRSIPTSRDYDSRGEGGRSGTM